MTPTFRVTGCRTGVLVCALNGASSACAAAPAGLPLGLAGPIGRAYSFVCGLPTGLAGPIVLVYLFVCGLPLPLAACCNCACGSPVCALTVLFLLLYLVVEFLTVYPSKCLG